MTVTGSRHYQYARITPHCQHTGLPLQLVKKQPTLPRQTIFWPADRQRATLVLHIAVQAIDQRDLVYRLGDGIPPYINEVDLWVTSKIWAS